jgi:two-component system, OmpR family, sensor kinase
VRPSIARRLLLLLTGSVFAIGALQTWLCYRASRVEVDIFYDQHMRLLAEAVAGATRSLGTVDGEIPIASGAAKGFTVRLRPALASGVETAAGQPAPGDTTALGFVDVGSTDAAGPWRRFTMRSPRGILVEVSQQVKTRDEMALAMATGTTWPIFALAPLVLVGVWWVVHRGVAPVRRIGRSLAIRAPDDPSALDPRDVPSEVAPLVDEINRLIARVGGLIASQRRFVADAAHELRSPLTALKLQVQAMLGGRPIEPALAAKLDRLERGIERMHRIVEQLLQLSRTEGDRYEIHERDVRPIELGDAVYRAVTDLADLAREKRIAVSIDIPDQLRVVAEAGDLAALVANLLDNAIKYSPDGGTVEISAAQSDQVTRLRIQDSGKGIPLSERERVFDRFYRVPGSDVAGSGLGLAIVRTIAERMGAVVELGDSQSGGLSVEVSFPVDSRPAPLDDGAADHRSALTTAESP